MSMAPPSGARRVAQAIDALRHGWPLAMNQGPVLLPVETAIACKAPSPPASSSAIATSPSTVHQKTRCGTGEFTFPPEAMVSITSEPESDEVMKNTITRTIPTKRVIFVQI